MDQKKYIDVLIDSLKDKASTLKSIIEKCGEQERLIAAAEFDTDAFDETISAKERLINHLRVLDTGFESVYGGVRDELSGNKERYAQQIREMKALIEEVTQLGNSIRVMEQRNESRLKSTLSAERQKIRHSRATVQAVSGYYRNMTNSSFVDPQYLDSKK